MEEHGLRLIVAGVTGRDRRRAEIASDATEEVVSSVARVVLVFRRSVRPTDAQRGADVVRELRDERRVGGRGARTRAMIEVRNMQDESEFFAQLSHEQRERSRIGAAGDSEDERTGAKECLGARV